jgi:hypothetical protein
MCLLKKNAMNIHGNGTLKPKNKGDHTAHIEEFGWEVALSGQIYYSNIHKIF